LAGRSFKRLSSLNVIVGRSCGYAEATTYRSTLNEGQKIPMTPMAFIIGVLPLVLLYNHKTKRPAAIAESNPVDQRA
jgi:hypothetical protein